MRAAKTLGHKIVNWELSNNNIKPYLEEMPYLRPIQIDLESLIGRRTWTAGRRARAA